MILISKYIQQLAKHSKLAQKGCSKLKMVHTMEVMCLMHYLMTISVTWDVM